jgi:hypothetical protein
MGSTFWCFMGTDEILAITSELRTEASAIRRYRVSV